MIFKPTTFGFTVFGEVEKVGNDEELIKGFQEDMKFTFLMKLDDPYFFNFTDIPVKYEPHIIYYFNNLSDHETGGELLLIEKDEIPKASSQRSKIPISSEVYTYTHQSADSSKTGTLTFTDEGFSLVQTLPNNNKNEFPFQFDLGQFHPGRCGFTVDEITDTFYAANEIYNEGVFGIIEIFAKDSVPGNYQYVDVGNIVTTREYIIPFTNRSTVWRYFIYDKSTNTLNNLQIDMTGAEFRLESFPAVSFPDDYALFKFTSGEPGSPEMEKALPIKEEPVTHIALSGNINGTGRDIIEHLPNPDVSLIKPDTVDHTKIYSDMILYL